MEQSDASERNVVEGKFGEGKRRYGLGLRETVIALQFLVMNLEHKLRVLFCLFFGKLFEGIAGRKLLIG